MKAKGPEVFSEEVEKGLHFEHVRLEAKKCIQRLWSEIQGPMQYLTCADCFWPATEPAATKFELLTENVLRNVAGVKWRILDKFEFPPWSLAHVALPGCPDETVPWQGRIP